MPPFDSRAAKQMKPGEFIAFAPEHPGLRLMASHSGRTWTYRYRHPDSNLVKQVKLGAWPAMGLSVAVEAWEKARAERESGGDPGSKARAAKAAKVEAAKVQRDAARETVGWLVEEYLTEVVERSRKPKGARESRRMMERAIGPWRGTPAREFTAAMAHEMISAVAATAPRVAAMTRQEMRAAWEHGMVRGAVSANVFAGRTLGGRLTSKARDRYLSDAEARALLRWWREPSTHSRTVSDALELVLRTGLRSGEVCAIHDRELHERQGVLWLDIPANRMKGGQPHSTPLVGRAREIVEARKGTGGYLFPRRDSERPIEQKVLGVEVYATSGRSGAAAYVHRKLCPVKGWAPHDLRRTARTMLAELGCPFEVGEAILAHTLPGVAAVYSRAAHNAARIEWLTKLNNHLDALSNAAQKSKR
jgi:integrase